MVAAVAAAAVVAKNVRLFIVTSLEVLRNMANADQDSELPTATVFKLVDCRSDMLGTVARTELAEEAVQRGARADQQAVPLAGAIIGPGAVRQRPA